MVMLESHSENRNKTTTVKLISTSMNFILIKRADLKKLIWQQAATLFSFSFGYSYIRKAFKV